MSFQKGNKHSKGRKPGSKNKQTLWVLEDLKKEGIDYIKVMADSIRSHDIEMLNALARLAPHIANRPKESLGLEGIEGIVINRLPEKGK